jgi:hypothetical protein
MSPLVAVMMAPSIQTYPHSQPPHGHARGGRACALPMSHAVSRGTRVLLRLQHPRPVSVRRRDTVCGAAAVAVEDTPPARRSLNLPQVKRASAQSQKQRLHQHLTHMRFRQVSQDANLEGLSSSSLQRTGPKPGRY